jgi:hypothetical protein
VIVVLSIIVVAFLQSMSIERQTARSYLNKYRAELAAKAAENKITDLLKRWTTNDTYSITQTNYSVNSTDKPPYYFISQGSGTATAKYIPLVSGASESIPALSMGTFPSQNQLFDPNIPDVSTTEPQLPQYLLRYYHDNTPETHWVYLKDVKGRNLARYCFWVEDLQGKLDLAVVGNQNNGGAQERGANLGNDKQIGEISPFTLFDKSLKADNGFTKAKEILNSRPHLLAGSTLKQVVETIDTSVDPKDGDASDVLLHFYYGLGYEDHEPEIIPPGFGFSNESQPKLSFNDLLSDIKNDKVTAITAVQSISNNISTNISTFASTRAGGMNATDYLNNLSASIIDYADADSQATTDGSTYRGIDSFPLVDQWFMMTAYTERTADHATFLNHYYIEVWNMSDKIISGTVRFNARNAYTISLGGSQLDFSQPPASGTLSDVAVSLQPNEKKMLDLGTLTYNVTTSSIPPKTVSVSQATLNFSYQLYWKDDDGGDFILVDRSGSPGGAYGPTKSFTYNSSSPPNSDSDWNAYIPGLIYRPNISSYLDGNIGDPRSAYYMQLPQDESAYETRAVVGGRTIRSGLTGKTYGETRPSYWPDPGFDDTTGTSIGSASKAPVPPYVKAQASRTDYALEHIGNYSDWKYRSITELGNIYDPGQWQQDKQWQDVNAKVTDLSGFFKKALSDITPSASPDPRFGGGYTLRIGRPEFSRFDNDETDIYTTKSRAADLLAIFSTEPTRSTRGLLNINTASRDALRALAAGITMTNPTYANSSPSDSSSTFESYSNPSVIYGPSKSAEADAFADAVIVNRPFYSQHELAARLKAANSDGTAKTSDFFWGNPNVWSSGKPLTWRDAAAEEYLRQIYDLTTVRSRNFRIHITGEALNPNTGKPVAISRRISDIYLHPSRDPANPTTITSFVVKHLYEISN